MAEELVDARKFVRKVLQLAGGARCEEAAQLIDSEECGSVFLSTAVGNILWAAAHTRFVERMKEEPQFVCGNVSFWIVQIHVLVH